MRDYFAAKALAGWIASTDQNRNPAEVADEIAGDCYSIADAMLRARESHNGDSPDMLTALETVLAGGHLNTGEQAIVANAIAKATGKSIDKVLRVGG